MENYDLQKLDPIIENYRGKAGSLIPVLHKVQTEIGYLPIEAQKYVADSLQLPYSKVFGVATFYTQFSLEPKGEYVIHVCDGTACHVRGSTDILKELREQLELTEEKITTDDLQFTLETVSCLGACGLAPVMTINDKVYGGMTPEKIKNVLAELDGSDQ